MSNPVLVEVTRGEQVESRHRGAFVVVDARGKKLLASGDTEHPVFPRSAVKAIQALPMVEFGAADAFGFHGRELALSQASHGGEPAHVAGVSAMLTAVGLDETALECGVHAPSHPVSAAELIRRGKTPNQLHNNCSGKHANFLALAQHLGHDHHGYVGAEHPVQIAARRGAAAPDRRTACAAELRHRWLLHPDLRRATHRAWRSASRDLPPASDSRMRAPMRRGASTRLRSPSRSMSPAPGSSAPT